MTIEEKERNIKDYINSLKHFDNVEDAKQILNNLKNDGKYNNEILYIEKQGKRFYIVCESKYWEGVSRLGYEFVPQYERNINNNLYENAKDSIEKPFTAILNKYNNELNNNIDLKKSTDITLIHPEYLKLKNLLLEQFDNDFIFMIDSGSTLPIALYPNEDRFLFELTVNYNLNFNSIRQQNIIINGKKYIIKSEELFNNIIKMISDNFQELIDCAKKQYGDNKLNINSMNEKCDLIFKLGNLIINIDGNKTGDMGIFANNFIKSLIELIINESK